MHRLRLRRAKQGQRQGRGESRPFVPLRGHCTLAVVLLERATDRGEDQQGGRQHRAQRREHRCGGDAALRRGRRRGSTATAGCRHRGCCSWMLLGRVLLERVWATRGAIDRRRTRCVLCCAANGEEERLCTLRISLQRVNGRGEAGLRATARQSVKGAQGCRKCGRCCCGHGTPQTTLAGLLVRRYCKRSVLGRRSCRAARIASHAWPCRGRGRGVALQGGRTWRHTRSQAFQRPVIGREKCGGGRSLSLLVQHRASICAA